MFKLKAALLFLGLGFLGGCVDTSISSREQREAQTQQVSGLVTDLGSYSPVDSLLQLQDQGPQYSAVLVPKAVASSSGSPLASSAAKKVNEEQKCRDAAYETLKKEVKETYPKLSPASINTQAAINFAYKVATHGYGNDGASYDKADVLLVNLTGNGIHYFAEDRKTILNPTLIDPYLVNPRFVPECETISVHDSTPRITEQERLVAARERRQEAGGIAQDSNSDQRDSNVKIIRAKAERDAATSQGQVTAKNKKQLASDKEYQRFVREEFRTYRNTATKEDRAAKRRGRLTPAQQNLADVYSGHRPDPLTATNNNPDYVYPERSVPRDPTEAELQQLEKLETRFEEQVPSLSTLSNTLEGMAKLGETIKDECIERRAGSTLCNEGSAYSAFCEGNNPRNRRKAWSEGETPQTACEVAEQALRQAYHKLDIEGKFKKAADEVLDLEIKVRDVIREAEKPVPHSSLDLNLSNRYTRQGFSYEEVLRAYVTTGSNRLSVRELREYGLDEVLQHYSGFSGIRKELAAGDREARTELAYEARMQGQSVAQIAKALGVSATTVRRDIRSYETQLNLTNQRLAA